MSTLTVKKSRVDLNDYDHEMDLCCRLFVGSLSPLLREVLEEIVNGSLQFSLSEIKARFELEENLDLFFEKLVNCKLIRVNADFAMVNKENRRLVESALAPFEEGFKPDLYFLKNQIKKVPIHIIPIWYSLPKNCNNLFLSIVEKYLYTPQLYEKYLAELFFDEPILDNLHKKLYDSKDFTLDIEAIQKEFELSNEMLEECLIKLEFNLSAITSYQHKEGKRIRVLTPFYEYKKYLVHKRTHQPRNIPTADVQLLRSSPFAFLEDLEKVQKTKLDQTSIMNLLHCDESYYEYLLDSMENLGFYQNSKTTSSFDSFLHMPKEQRAMAILRFSHALTPIYEDAHIQEKAFKEIQKATKDLLPFEFVTFEQFFAQLTIPMNQNEGVVLDKQGMRYIYRFPEFSQVEKEYIRNVFTQTLFQAGIVQIGYFHQELCLSITPFGKSVFGAL